MAYPLAEQKALQEQKASHSNIDTYIALNDLKNLTMYGFDSPNDSSYLENYTDYIKALGDIDIDVVLSEFKEDAPKPIWSGVTEKAVGYWSPSKNKLVLSGGGITKDPKAGILPHETAHVLTDTEKIFGEMFFGKKKIGAFKEYWGLENSIEKILNELTEKTGELYEDIYGVWGARSNFREGVGYYPEDEGHNREALSQMREFLAEAISNESFKEDVIEKAEYDAFEIPYKGMSRGERFSSFPTDITDIVKLLDAFKTTGKMKAISKKYGNFPDELWELIEGSGR